MESRHNLWLKSQVKLLDNEFIKHVFLYGLYTLFGVASLRLSDLTLVASPIFPAAGLAMAVVLLWGYRFAITVGFASFTVASLGNEAALNGVASWASLIIGSGAALQAALGRALVVKMIGWPLALDLSRNILGFLLIAAPLSCVVSASMGVSALVYFDVVASEKHWIEWQTWWLGDSLGVIILSPVVIAMLAKPRKDWIKRVWSVAVSATLALSALILIWSVSQSNVQERARLQFSRTADQHLELINARLLATDHALQSLQQLFVLQPELTREQFRQFSSHFLEKIHGVKAIGFIKPSVTRCGFSVV